MNYIRIEVSQKLNDIVLVLSEYHLWRIYLYEIVVKIGSDNGLEPTWRQVIIWTNDDLVY